MKLRPWQQECLEKSVQNYEVNQKLLYAIMACTGAGKTIAAIVIANSLIKKDFIDRIIVVAPTKRVLKQWVEEFTEITSLPMGKITSRSLDFIDNHICITWQALQGVTEILQALCSRQRIMVIFDEIHHAGIENIWGESASTLNKAKSILILTATPFRSDGSQICWLQYNDGELSLPESQTYSLSYGQGVELGYCRPLTCHRHQAYFEVTLDEGITVKVSGDQPVKLPEKYLSINQLAERLSFIRLIKKIETNEEGIPIIDSYHGSMIEWGIAKLNQLRQQKMSAAAGIIFAPNIAGAEQLAYLLTLINGEPPVLVHSNIKNAEDLIEKFNQSNDRWIVSVNLLGEGVNISRLRVAIFLANATTELVFRQYLGRLLRNFGSHDETRAYAIIPDCQPYIDYALRIEAEMPASYRDLRSETESFQARESTFPCPECGAYNTTKAKRCHECGEVFYSKPRFQVTLENALRNGVIARGKIISEEETQNSELIAPSIREIIARSGDRDLYEMIRRCPDELIWRLRHEILR